MTDFEDAPKVTLAGTEYAVPPVAFREASKILPLVNAVFTSKGLDCLEDLAKIVFYGLKRANPDLTLDGLLDMPVSIPAMTEAALVVCKQAGFKKADSSGEAGGVTNPQ